MVARIRVFGDGQTRPTRTEPLPARLTVLQGTDVMGHSAQITLLCKWKTEMKQVLADMRAISPQHAEEELVQAVAAEKHQRSTQDKGHHQENAR